MVNDAVSGHEGGVLSTEPFRRKIDEHTSVSPRDGALKSWRGYVLGYPVFAAGAPALKEIQDLVIAEALQRADGNQTIAARLLGMSKQALNNRLNRARNSTNGAETVFAFPSHSFLFDSSVFASQLPRPKEVNICEFVHFCLQFGPSP